MGSSTNAVRRRSWNCTADKKYLGATPGIIQILHTWNQEIGYHVHMHNDKRNIMTRKVVFS